MALKNMKKEELELLSYKDITNLILEESKRTVSTANLFKKIIKLLDLPEKTFEAKIGDYYTSLATDKRFILLENGNWDLRKRYTSDKVVKYEGEDEDDEEEEVEEEEDTSFEEAVEEDNYSDDDDNYNDDNYNDDTDDDLKDLVVMDEDELELEQ